MAPVDPLSQSRPRASWLRRAPFILIILAAAIGAFTLRDTFSIETLARHREALLAFRDAHYLLTVVGFLLAYVAIVAAASTGAVLVFLAARAGFGESLSAKVAAAGGKAARLQASLRQNEWSVLLIMRLVPAVPFFLANLIPAFVGVRLSRFAITTFVGIIPGTLVFTAIGAGLGEVFAKGEVPDLGVIFSPPVLLPLLGLAILAALPIIVKTLQRRPNGTDQD
jgi:uncharacterized membrane protein YdjX (TVP38/TMEM64 family)